MKNVFFVVVFLMANAILLSAQAVEFANPSFEGTPAHSRLPNGWEDCGFEGESPGDTHPDFTFRVIKRAYEGHTYLGLVTRDNNTWESVSAKLKGTLDQGSCYDFSIALAKSDEYWSVSKVTLREANYVAPTRLQIWGGTEACGLSELLAESADVNHSDWQVYSFTIQPQMASYTYITLEVIYGEPGRSYPTNGNLLLDAASAFRPNKDCAAAEGDPIVLQLPSPGYFSEEEALKVFLTNTLADLRFDENLKLIDQEFMIEGDNELRRGSPQLFAMQYAIQFDESKQWELVVYDEDEVTQELKVLQMGLYLPKIANANFAIHTYDPAIYDGVSWYCMSIANGLYLRHVGD